MTQQSTDSGVSTYVAPGTADFFNKQLTAYRKRLAACEQRPASDAFSREMEEFLQFLRTYSDKAIFEEFEKSAAFVEHQKYFTDCLLNFAMGREDLTYAELMAKTGVRYNKFKEIIGDRYLVRYGSMTEIPKLVDFSKCHNYVMIGMGRVPASLLFVHDQTDVPEIVGIDNYAEAVEKCQDFIDAFKIDRLSVHFVDGAQYDYSKADVIYLGYFAKPRQAVLNRILETAKKSVQLILRDPYYTGTLFCEPLLPSVKDKMEVKVQGEDMPWYLNRHFILGFKDAR